MEIVFYEKGNGRYPVKEFVDTLSPRDQAKVLACLKHIEECGFASPRVQFKQIERRLWEIKIRLNPIGFRIFYILLKEDVLVLLHAYKKQSQKAPIQEIELAKKRMQEVLRHEKINT